MALTESMAQNRTIRLGLLGLGTVGTGVINLLASNRQEIIRRCGIDFVVTQAAARNPDKARDCDLSGITVSGDPVAVAAHDDVDMVVELMGGEGLARDAVLAAIAAGKPVVTANKALIALHGKAIQQAATEKQVELGFEAAVAGGIPVLKALREGLAGNQIEWLAGIINGTCNYILTQMTEAGRDFDDVLAEAQKLGYAEADPSFDVDGIDAAHKLTILAAMAFGMPLDFDALTIEGVRDITADDIAHAADLGYVIKHLGIARRQDKGVELRVHPTLLKKKEFLANVNGVMNAVMIKGDQAGPTAYYGAGAGAEATASAVVADIIDLSRQGEIAEALAYTPEGIVDIATLAADDFVCEWYLCMDVDDRPGVLATISGLLAEKDISIEAIQQKEPVNDDDQATVVLLTGPVKQSLMIEAQAHIQSQNFVHDGIRRLRVEHFEA